MEIDKKRAKYTNYKLGLDSREMESKLVVCANYKLSIYVHNK